MRQTLLFFVLLFFVYCEEKGSTERRNSKEISEVLEVFTCYGILSTDSSVCNGHGDCTGNDECTCSTGYTENDYCYEEISGFLQNPDDQVASVTLTPPLRGKDYITIGTNGFDMIGAEPLDPGLRYYEGLFENVNDTSSEGYILISSYFYDLILHNGKIHYRMTSKSEELEYYKGIVGETFDTSDVNRLLIVNRTGLNAIRSSVGTVSYETVIMWGETTNRVVIQLNFFNLTVELHDNFPVSFAIVINTVVHSFLEPLGFLVKKVDIPVLNDLISYRSIFIEITEEGEVNVKNGFENEEMIFCDDIFYLFDGVCPDKVHAECVSEDNCQCTPDVWGGESCDECLVLNPYEGTCIWGNCSNNWSGNLCDECIMFFGIDGTCVENCDSHYYPYGATPGNGYACTENCFDYNQFFPESGNTCVEFCPNYLLGGYCVSSCPLYIGIDNYSCVDNCDGFYYPIEGNNCLSEPEETLWKECPDIEDNIIDFSGITGIPFSISASRVLYNIISKGYKNIEEFRIAFLGSDSSDSSCNYTIDPKSYSPQDELLSDFASLKWETEDCQSNFVFDISIDDLINECGFSSSVENFVETLKGVLVVEASGKRELNDDDFLNVERRDATVPFEFSFTKEVVVKMASLYSLSDYEFKMEEPLPSNVWGYVEKLQINYVKEKYFIDLVIVHTSEENKNIFSFLGVIINGNGVTFSENIPKNSTGTITDDGSYIYHKFSFEFDLPPSTNEELCVGWNELLLFNFSWNNAEDDGDGVSVTNEKISFSLDFDVSNYCDAEEESVTLSMVRCVSSGTDCVELVDDSTKFEKDEEANFMITLVSDVDVNSLEIFDAEIESSKDGVIFSFVNDTVVSSNGLIWGFESQTQVGNTLFFTFTPRSGTTPDITEFVKHDLEEVKLKISVYVNFFGSRRSKMVKELEWDFSMGYVDESKGILPYVSFGLLSLLLLLL